MHFVSEEEEEGKFWCVFSLPPPKEKKVKNTTNKTSCRNVQNDLLQKNVFKSSLQGREEEKESTEERKRSYQTKRARKGFQSMQLFLI
jgi:hypothetical protein